MTKSKEQMMSELFVVYWQQCSHKGVKYETYDETKTQGHIVLDDGIEIINFTNYQGEYAIKFAFSRDTEEYFFNTYPEAVRYSSMPIDEFNEYVLSITL
jgi:hypothetical protein